MCAMHPVPRKAVNAVCHVPGRAMHALCHAGTCMPCYPGMQSHAALCWAKKATLLVAGARCVWNEAFTPSCLPAPCSEWTQRSPQRPAAGAVWDLPGVRCVPRPLILPQLGFCCSIAEGQHLSPAAGACSFERFRGALGASRWAPARRILPCSPVEKAALSSLPHRSTCCQVPTGPLPHGTHVGAL